MGIEETKQLNELLETQKKLYNEQNAAIKSQLSMMQQMVSVLRSLDLERVGRNIEGLNSAVNSAAESVEKLGQGQQTMQQINRVAEEMDDSLERLAAGAENFGQKLLKLAPVVATLEGLGAGLTFSMNVMGGLITVGQSLVGTMFNLAASIISVPFKMLNGLMEMAAQGGGSELRQAIEDVRQEFGDLYQNEAKGVMQSWRQLDHFGGQLAETGLSIWRTMGNMAESLKRVHEMATQLGPIFSSVTNEFMGPKAVERLHAYQKGLGLTEEGFRAMGEEAVRRGVSVQEMGREITSIAFAMGESFGINGKLIGREIGNMIDDFEHFGNIGVQELAQVAVYARKLGVEVEKLTGVLDQFADFDKAAESVAQLSQAFGIQLDTLKMVQEQDPAANIERLRKAFFAAGRSVEQMTRQERALLATHTGLDQKTLSLVFSAEKQGMTYEDIQKGGEDAQKQQLSQAEAMEKLSNSIERLVKSGQAMKGGFFDIFLQGFMRGIKWTREFWGLMWNLRRAMRETRWAGVRVGQMFVEYFPGVRDILKGIAELFDPRRFRKMLDGVTSAFRTFFKAMSSDPRTALPELLNKLKESFFNWFNTSEPAGRQILEGFKSFFKAVGQIFAGLLREAMKGATKAFRFMIDFIKNPSQVIGGVTQATDGFLGFLMEVLEPAWEALRDEWPALKEAFLELMKTAWQKIKPPLIDFLKENMIYILGVAFGPAIITGGLRGLSTVLLAGLVKATGKATASFVQRGPSLVRSAFQKLARRAPAGDVAAGGRSAAALTGATKAAGDAANAARQTRVSMGDVGKMALIALVITAGLIAIGVAMVELADTIQERGITTENIRNAAVVMIATGAIMLELAGTIAILAAVGQAIQSQVQGVLIGVAAVGVVGAAMAFGAMGMIELFKGYSEGEVNNAVKIMGATAAFFLAAIAVTFGAGVIGAIISATSGIAAAVVLAGLAALGAMMIGMTETIKQVIDVVKSVRVTTSDMRSLKAFTIVLSSMGEFAGNIAHITEATSPGFVDLIRGGEPMTERLKETTNLVQSMGSELRSMVRTVVEQANILGGGEEDLRKVEVIAGVLTTIGSVARNLRPPEEIMDVGWIEQFGGEDVSSRIREMTNYVTSVVQSLHNSVIDITREFSQIAQAGGFTAESLDAAKAIGAILQSVGLIGRAMTVYISREYATTDPDTLRRLAPQLGAVVESMMSAIVGQGGHNIFSRMAGVIRFILDGMRDVSPAEARRVEQFTPMIQSAFTAIAGISTLLGNVGLGAAVQGDPERTKQNIDQMIRMANTVTYGVGNNIKGIITSIVENFSGLDRGQISNVKSGMEAVKSVLESISQFTGIADSLKGLGGGAAAGQEILTGRDALSTAFGAIVTLISGVGDKMGLEGFIDGILPGLNNIGTKIEPLSDALPDFIEAMRLTKGAITAVDRVYSGEVFQNVSQIDEAVLTKTKDAVTSMVTNINEIGQALRGVRGFNINSELQAVNNRLNLGSSGRLQIAHQPVQFNVSWRITLDSEELEKALVERQGSTIQTKRDTVT